MFVTSRSGDAFLLSFGGRVGLSTTRPRVFGSSIQCFLAFGFSSSSRSVCNPLRIKVVLCRAGYKVFP